jgi:hypothetical protein
MATHIEDYVDFLLEAKSDKEPFEIFAKNRLAGASKIAENAETKGGDAMLTYHHFVVKLPVYKQAAEGKFKLDKAITNLERLMTKLNAGAKKDVKMRQVDFQKTMGLIEVWGELIIKYHETH